MHCLSLHHLTALDASPLELVEIAAREGLDAVSLFTAMPEEHRARYPMVEPGEAQALGKAMHSNGVGCHCLEVFGLSETPDWDDFAQGLEIGAMLGAQRATTHVHDVDAERAIDNLTRLKELAAVHGIAPVLEFNPYSQLASLESALALAERVDVGLLLDTLHAMRTATTVEATAAAAPRIAAIQISDGPAEISDDARFREAMQERMLPGDGAFPLREILAALGSGITIDIEVPRRSRREAGADPATRCQEAVDATRALLASLT